MKACILCQKSTSTPRNFLLHCTSCLHAYHHRCLVPPVPDKELIALIQAFNARRHEPGASLIWTCPTCTSTRKQNNTQPAPIVIDVIDDDEVLQPVTKKVTGRKTIQPAPRVTSKTTGRPDGIRVIDDPFSMSPAPSATPRPALKASSTLAPLSGFIDLTMSSDDDTQSRKQAIIKADSSDEDPLEYVTPPPAPMTAAPSRLRTVTFEEHSRIKIPDTPVVIPPPRPIKPATLTSYMNERHVNDMWAVAAQRRKPDLAPSFVIKQEDADGGGSLPHALSTSKRKKPTARKLNVEQQTWKSFTLNANAWMQERPQVHRAS